MEVILAGLVACIIIFNLIKQIINLKSEANTLGSMLESTMDSSDRALEDHRAAELELALIKSRLEGMKDSTLTPENSIPKDLHQEKVLELAHGLTTSNLHLKDMTEKFETLRGKQISERVRLGNVGENFCAFHNQFPYDRKNVKALFQPIDLIYFGEDEIVFIDVKTGGSQLSKKQRMLRDHIKEGKVRFEVHRIDDTGYTIKKEE